MKGGFSRLENFDMSTNIGNKDFKQHLIKEKAMKAIKQTLILAAAGLFAALSLSACGGGGGGGTQSATVTGKTTGEITGFGSVIVNGIEFSRKTGLADDKIKLGFDNLPNQAEDKLKAGMMVNITGTFNSVTGKGEYEAIEFQPELRGRLDDNGVDLVNDKIKIMGREVQIEANTQFDSLRDLAELSADQGGNVNHPEIEVSGILDDNGILHATRIAKKTLDFSNSGIAQVKGKMAALPAPTVNGFTIGTTAIVVDANTVFANMLRTDLPASAGLVMEVKGTLTAGVFTATRVEKKLAVEAQLNDNVRVKGIAAGAVANNAFILNGPNGPVTVKVANAVFLNGGAAATSAIVAAGAKLQVEGSIEASGALVATKVAIELEKNLKLEGNAAASAFNATTSKLTLNGITVDILPTTRKLDTSVNPAVALNLATIAAGDHLQITGYVDAAGAMKASVVQKTKASTLVFIQGPVTAKTASTLTILGITVDTSAIGQAKDFVDSSSGTKIPGTGTAAAAQAAFFTKIVAGTSVVKAKGAITGTSMAATAVELEQK